mmetsp:Transcript_16146/g.34117  ORF Transcript_16146/g.34117 Transcript_16146/m.34117 type:complete len:391 (+) Transcript_16146:93-1265(+)
MNASTQAILSQHHNVYFREQFPVKLYTMLVMASNGITEISTCVSWLPHGRAFKIWNEDKFMTVVVPLFFKQTKIRSFFRQLSFWGYRRIIEGPDAGAWYNEFFLRGQPNEMKKMARIKKRGKSKQLNDPDFCSMPPLPSTIANVKPTMIMEGGRVIMGNNNNNNNCNGVHGPSRRVTMEMQPAFQFNCHPNDQTPTDLGQQCDFVAPQSQPQTAFSKHVSSPCPIVSPMHRLPNVVDGYNELVQRCQQENNDNGQHHLAVNPFIKQPASLNPSHSSQRLSRRSKSTLGKVFAHDDARSRLLAGATPLPFPCGSSTTADVKPLAFGGVSEVRSVVDIKPLLFGNVMSEKADPANDDESKNSITTGLEPLPFDEGISTDEFAVYIDNAIQML